MRAAVCVALLALVAGVAARAPYADIMEAQKSEGKAMKAHQTLATDVGGDPAFRGKLPKMTLKKGAYMPAELTELKEGERLGKAADWKKSQAEFMQRARDKYSNMKWAEKHASGVVDGSYKKFKGNTVSLDDLAAPLAAKLRARFGQNAALARKAAVLRKGDAAPELEAQKGGVEAQGVPLTRKLQSALPHLTPKEIHASKLALQDMDPDAAEEFLALLKMSHMKGDARAAKAKLQTLPEGKRAALAGLLRMDKAAPKEIPHKEAGLKKEMGFKKHMMKVKGAHAAPGEHKPAFKYAHAEGEKPAEGYQSNHRQLLETTPEAKQAARDLIQEALAKHAKEDRVKDDSKHAVAQRRAAKKGMLKAFLAKQEAHAGADKQAKKAAYEAHVAAKHDLEAFHGFKKEARLKPSEDKAGFHKQMKASIAAKHMADRIAAKAAPKAVEPAAVAALEAKLAAEAAAEEAKAAHVEAKSAPKAGDKKKAAHAAYHEAKEAEKAAMKHAAAADVEGPTMKNMKAFREANPQVSKKEYAMKHLPAKNAFDPVRKGYGQPIEKFGPKGKAVDKLVKGGRALLSVHGRDIPKAAGLELLKNNASPGLMKSVLQKAIAKHGKARVAAVVGKHLKKQEI